MKSILIFSFILMINIHSSFGQQRITLQSGKSYTGQILEQSDSLIIFETEVHGKKMTLNLDPKEVTISQSQAHKFNIDPNKIYVVTSKNGARVRAKVVELDSTIVLSHIVGNKGKKVELQKNKIASIKQYKALYGDIGLVRGGALIGLELEVPVGAQTTIYGGGGLRGYGAGFVFYFNEGYKGLGIKLNYQSFGWKQYYSGSIAAGELSFKMRPGISLNLGLGVVVDKGNFDFGGTDVVLTYGIGLSF